MNTKWMSGTVCLLGIALMGAVVCAQEDAEENQPKRRRLPFRLLQQIRPGGEVDEAIEADEAVEAVETNEADPSDGDLDVKDSREANYWIGARFAPLAEFDELVRAQLNLKQALVAVKVVPDGPAHRAGLRKYDVLLSFAGEQVAEIDELVEAIGEHQDAQVTMVILRGGKKRELQVTPAQRPEQFEEVIEFPEIEELRLRADEIGKRTRERHGEGRGFMFKLETDDKDEDGVTILRLAPRGLFRGIIGGVLSLPKDLDIRIDKSGSEPARIHVKSDEGEWDVTEENLDELPKEVRGHVEAFWGTPGKLDWHHHWGKKTQRILEDVGVKGINIDALHDNVRDMIEAVESEQPDSDENVEALKSELEQLRREVRELKQRKQDAPAEVDT